MTSPPDDSDVIGPPLGRATGILLLLVVAVCAIGLWDRTGTERARPGVATLREAVVR